MRKKQNPISPNTKKITRTFIWLFLLFAIPLMIASLMVIKEKTLSTKKTNHGVLITPPLDIASLQLSVAQQKIWENRWLLLYVTPKSCDHICEKTLYQIRQIRTATGKDMDRIERGILTFSDRPADHHLTELLNTAFLGTVHLIVPLKNFLTFSQKNLSSQQIILQQGGIYIVDPLGNVMLFYSSSSDPMGIFDDLILLLKFSHIG